MHVALNIWSDAKNVHCHHGSAIHTHYTHIAIRNGPTPHDHTLNNILITTFCRRKITIFYTKNIQIPRVLEELDLVVTR